MIKKTHTLNCGHCGGNNVGISGMTRTGFCNTDHTIYSVVYIKIYSISNVPERNINDLKIYMHHELQDLLINWSGIYKFNIE